MHQLAEAIERRTTTDVVFDQLYDEILSLKLLPGTKLSEADVARRFGVSRQPVRDAFSRLGNLDLLMIRPQKATEVRGFSMERINHARFVRLAVELEVIRRACAVWGDKQAGMLQGILDEQSDVIANGEPEKFHALDYYFHKLICELGGYPLAFETIEECKQKIDRLCLLSLGRASEAETLFKDHQRIADALKRGDSADATDAVRVHLARLDETVADIHREHLEYFE